jgi:hypothetical protein
MVVAESMEKTVSAPAASEPTTEPDLLVVSIDDVCGEISACLAPLERVRAVAEEMLHASRRDRWGRLGRLEPEDLTNNYATLSDEGVEVFSVIDAGGYEGHFKCNLLAFELAYRAGMRVPVISRCRGWAYPGPLAVARMVEGRTVSGGWARIADDASQTELDDALAAGRVMLLVGVGLGGRFGHMGLVEEIHELDRGPSGRLQRIEYTGWEANTDGADLRRRAWERGRFTTIHLIELVEPEADQGQVVPIGPPPDLPSVADAARLAPEALAAAALNPRRGAEAWSQGLRTDEGRPPRLPVAHSILGGETVFGPVVDVESLVSSRVSHENNK